MKPHQVKGWLNPKIDDPELYHQQVKQVCDAYHEASELAEQGVHVLCTDEKTGIQALERAQATKPMKPGQVERVEQEYIRHGTTSLTASRDVVTGQLIAPMIQATRNEADFVEHIRQVVRHDPTAPYLLVMDQLNTHKSESLVRFVAAECGIPEEALGEKGKSGVLKTMESRAAFLTDPSHRIRVIYTPKHSSWLNQIECWFSILSRRLLNKRASFVSVEDLEQRIAAFIDYYNEHLAKPFRWTYAGKLLKM
ncbi:transposase [Fodinisporobacter ferrooxydans]|uniref:Transposase n=1 Tax=Fodinisporobacter ferrooxydans TaxID=2901836 RepID=A0ABY4CHT9_9BACL|nr:transposase [Alicyclobacillaceae bacterium MYW30-H2]UOF89584.1 transposase [Alicyclobacillaceae bacterium MYW30-H2]UOF90204.1 transposase [Alicyclobacillaceae bacterium MYW30-H2]UOF91045.1 transposase [Alicyclobacillaceae bacterium MYW30-H2]UOF92349.1 transposase [Alicyclobacillaceae bacterium MYW30-H2]